MKITGKDIWKGVKWFAGALLLCTGMSFAVFLNQIKAVWNAPKEIAILKDDIYKRDSIIIKQAYEIHDLQDAQEMFYQVFRLMTDDHDTIRWKIMVEGDIEYPVDIRSTAEDVELAFVDLINIIYRAYIDEADIMKRKYLLRHHNGGQKGTYIEKQ